MSNIEHFEVYSNEDRTLTLNGRDSTNAAFNLTGNTVQVLVGVPPNRPELQFSILSYPGTVTNASAGQFTISVLHGDTQDLHGDYTHWATATNTTTGAETLVSTGTFKVRRSLFS